MHRSKRFDSIPLRILPESRISMSLPITTFKYLNNLRIKNTASSAPTCSHLRSLNEETDSIQSSVVDGQLNNTSDRSLISTARIQFTIPQTAVPAITKSERAFSKLLSKFLKTHDFKKKLNLNSVF